MAALLHPLLFLFVLLLLAPPASAGAKLDLTEYLAPASVVGDFKTFAVDNGDERRFETVEVQLLPQGRFEVTELRVNGEAIGGSAGIVIPGRKSISTALASGAVLIRWRPPGLRRPLRVAPGRLVKARGGGRAEVNGVKIGSASLRASALLVPGDGAVRGDQRAAREGSGPRGAHADLRRRGARGGHRRARHAPRRGHDRGRADSLAASGYTISA